MVVNETEMAVVLAHFEALEKALDRFAQSSAADREKLHDELSEVTKQVVRLQERFDHMKEDIIRLGESGLADTSALTARVKAIEEAREKEAPARWRLLTLASGLSAVVTAALGAAGVYLFNLLFRVGGP